jgi:AbrB family looped-hinge helix DNA binding protein
MLTYIQVSTKMKTAVTTNNKAVVSSKGQVVIPMAVRKQLGIHVGNELLFFVREDGVIEVRQTKRSIKMFFGRCKRKNARALTIKEIDEAIMNAVSEDKK